MKDYSIIQVGSILGIKNKNFKSGIISNILIDSRKLTNPSETLFFAIETKSNNGHKYINELYDAGVRNFVVESLQDEWKNLSEANFLQVKSTIDSLQKLVAFHRTKYDIPVIGITGSNGKTVVKEWLYQLLQDDYEITRSPRSYNSQIGVPLSVWQLQKSTELAIFEAGISLPDEMEKLEKVIKPTIGILTNIGEAHQENFTSLLQKCMQKMELFSNSEVIIYNEDNQIISQGADMMILSPKSFTWSTKNVDAQLYISQIEKLGNCTKIDYLFMQLKHSITIPFIDNASIENSIHCLATLLYLHVNPEVISKRFAKLEPVAMRLDVLQGKNNCLIINDTYNSDINSIQIALDFQNQRSFGTDLKRTVVISDILQTGVIPKSLYKKVAEIINDNHVDKLIGIGSNISEYSEYFNLEKYFFKTTEEFIQSYPLDGFNNELLLLKGARNFHFEKLTALFQERTHETVLEVDLDALVHNFNFYKSKLSQQTKIVCMVKADAYGAGAVEVAKTLQYHRCDYLAVAITEEGILLREQGIHLPIIVLNPELNGFDELYSYNLEPEIYNFRILEEFIKEAEHRGLTDYPVHLKIDTGMHRLGFLPDEISKLLDIVNKQKGLKVTSIFSHLAASESWIFDEFTSFQMDTFNKVYTKIQSGLQYKIYKHILNSAGIERFSEKQADMVRLGIGLYGISPTNLHGLDNVTTLKSTILQVKNLPFNETIGYGRKEKLDHDAQVATVRIGYADGLNRKLGNRKGRVYVNENYLPIIGSICMDLSMIDATGMNLQEGDKVEIFGKNISILELADICDTIPYEILTSISHRVKRVYLKE